MRHTVFSIILVIIALGCQPKKTNNQSVASSKPVSVEMTVSGMMCEGCVETVRSSLAQVQGVDTVIVSLEKANALVTFKPQVTDTIALRKAVEINGYKITSSKPVPGGN